MKISILDINQIVKPNEDGTFPLYADCGTPECPHCQTKYIVPTREFMEVDIWQCVVCKGKWGKFGEPIDRDICNLGGVFFQEDEEGNIPADIYSHIVYSD